MNHCHSVSHPWCSPGPSSRPDTLGPQTARSDSGQSSRRGGRTVCCTWCRSSSRHIEPWGGRRYEPRARRAGWSARGRRGWSCRRECCARLAARRQLQTNRNATGEQTEAENSFCLLTTVGSHTDQINNNNNVRKTCLTFWVFFFLLFQLIWLFLG